MSDHNAPSLSTLVQRFFLEHLGQHRAVSRETVAAYRDTLRLLLGFAAQRLHRTPSAITLLELDAPLLLAFLDHLEKERGNSVRSRNARLAAIRTFLKYAGHHDIGALATIERALAIRQKRFERPMVGFLSRDEILTIIEAPDAKTWAGQRDRAMFSTLYNTGARVSEQCAGAMLCSKDSRLSIYMAKAVRTDQCRCGEQRRRCFVVGAGGSVSPRPMRCCFRTAAVTG